MIAILCTSPHKARLRLEFLGVGCGILSGNTEIYFYSDTPMLAATATVTKTSLPIILQQLNIVDYKLVYVPPERPNIYLEVRNRTTIEEDFAVVLSDLKLNLINTNRVLVYCQSLNMCSSLYAHFLYTLGDNSYYPPGAPKLAENRLFGMYQ